jgi:DNA-binding NtrC family response regulator
MQDPKPRILFIDDALSVLQVADLLLQPLEAAVDCVRSVREALGCLADKEYDAVVSDVDMPELSGFDLLQLMRERNCDTPVILISGYSDAETIEKARAMGAFAFVPKPLDRPMLLRAVKRALNRKASEAGSGRAPREAHEAP